MVRVIEENKLCIKFKDCEDLKTYLYEVLYVGVEKGDIKRKFLYTKEDVPCTHRHLDGYKDHDYKAMKDCIYDMLGSAFKNYTVEEEIKSKYLTKIFHLKNENRILASKLKKYQRSLYLHSRVCSGDHVLIDGNIYASQGFKQADVFEKQKFEAWNNLIANTAKRIGANGNKMQRYRTLIKQKENLNESK